MRADEPRPRREPTPTSEARASSCATACARSAARGKERIAIDVISPLLLADDDDDDVGSLLAGEFMGDFGGFLSRELRASDFALGYESASPGSSRACAPASSTTGRRAHGRLRRVQAPYDPDEVRSGEAELSRPLARRPARSSSGSAPTSRGCSGAGAIDLRSRIPDGLGRALRAHQDRLAGRRLVSPRRARSEYISGSRGVPSGLAVDVAAPSARRARGAASAETACSRARGRARAAGRRRAPRSITSEIGCAHSWVALWSVAAVEVGVGAAVVLEPVPAGSWK